MTDAGILSTRAIVIVTVTALLFAIAAYVGSLFMQRAYVSTVSVLSAVEDNDNALARVTNQFGAVAGLLGVGAQNRRDVNESLATLRSRLLCADFINAEQLLDDIVEIIGPEALADMSDDDRLQAAVSYFQTNILGVAYDNRSSLMTVSITWVDRQRAADLANSYLAFANEAMRQRAVAAARNRLSYLEKAATEAPTIELRQAIYGLVESQVNAEMMAATKPDFAFIVVDPAVPAREDEFVRPQSMLLALIAAMFGAGAAIVVLLWRARSRRAQP